MEVVKVKPNAKGKYVVRLYGHDIELVPVDTAKKEAKAEQPVAE